MLKRTTMLFVAMVLAITMATPIPGSAGAYQEQLEQLRREKAANEKFYQQRIAKGK